MPAFAFDCVETGGSSRFVHRGGRPVAEIAPGSLVAARKREDEDLRLTRGRRPSFPRR